MTLKKTLKIFPPLPRRLSIYVANKNLIQLKPHVVLLKLSLKKKLLPKNNKNNPLKFIALGSKMHRAEKIEPSSTP